QSNEPHPGDRHPLGPTRLDIARRAARTVRTIRHTRSAAAVETRRIGLFAAAVLVGVIAACADDAPVPIEPRPATLAELTGPWRAAPLSLDPVMWSTIEVTCRRDIEFPAGAHALHIEVRGGGVAIVRMTGAQSGTCDALEITPDGRVNGAGGGTRSE